MTAGWLLHRGFALTFVGLVALAAISLGLSFLPLGGWETPLALLIAGAKAALVVFVFMEVWAAPFVVRLLWVVVMVWMVLLVGLMAADVMTRIGPEVRPPRPAPGQRA